MRHKLGKTLLIFGWIILFWVPSTIAQTLTFAVGFSQPPYIIKDSNSGIEIELLREIFSLTRRDIHLNYFPNIRTIREFEKKQVDGVLNVRKGMLKEAYYSDVFITFQNKAISLAKNKFQIDSIQSLKNYYLVAFQNARTLLGPKFNAVVQNKTNYREVARQLLQVNLLFNNRTEVVIADQNIFLYYRKQAQQLGVVPINKLSQALAFHSIFPPTKYRVAFREETIRDDFNKGLKIIKDNGVYQEIIEKYSKLMTL